MTPVKWNKKLLFDLWQDNNGHCIWLDVKDNETHQKPYVQTWIEEQKEEQCLYVKNHVFSSSLYLINKTQDNVTVLESECYATECDKFGAMICLIYSLIWIVYILIMNMPHLWFLIPVPYLTYLLTSMVHERRFRFYCALMALKKEMK